MERLTTLETCTVLVALSLPALAFAGNQGVSWTSVQGLFPGPKPKQWVLSPEDLAPWRSQAALQDGVAGVGFGNERTWKYQGLSAEVVALQMPFVTGCWHGPASFIVGVLDSNRRLVARSAELFSEGSDANATEKPYLVDGAPYRISDTETAFGVRIVHYKAGKRWCYADQVLHLFRVVGKDVVRILTTDAFYAQVDWVESAKGDADESEEDPECSFSYTQAFPPKGQAAVFRMLSKQTKGFDDIQRTQKGGATVTYRWDGQRYVMEGKDPVDHHVREEWDWCTGRRHLAEEGLLPSSPAKTHNQAPKPSPAIAVAVGKRGGSVKGSARRMEEAPRHLGAFSARDVFLILHPEASKETYARLRPPALPQERRLMAAARMRSDGSFVAWDGVAPSAGDHRGADASYTNIVVNQNTMEILAVTWNENSQLYATSEDSIRVVEWKGDGSLLAATVRWASVSTGHPRLLWEGADAWDEVALLSRKDDSLVVEARTARPIFAGVFSAEGRRPLAAPLVLSSAEQGLVLGETVEFSGKFECYRIESRLILRRAGGLLLPVLWAPTGFCNSRIDKMDDYWPECSPCARSGEIVPQPSVGKAELFDLRWAPKDSRASIVYRWDGHRYAAAVRTLDDEVAKALRCDLLSSGVLPMNQNSPPPEFRECQH